MTRVFLDSNVVLDIVAEREPFFMNAEYLRRVATIREHKLMISSASIKSLIYIMDKTYRHLPEGDKRIWEFVKLCDLVNTHKSTVHEALRSEFRDKEDASEYFTALDNHADCFITRDLKDYKNSLSPILPVFTPNQFKEIISAHTIFA